MKYIFTALLFSFLIFQSFASIAEEASVARQVTEENGQWIYTVNERAPTVWRISTELYGNPNIYSKKIIEWNQLKEPYRLSVGQKLTLQEAPKLTENEGTQKLIVWWQGQKNEAMVKRLEATIISEQPETVVVAPAPSTETPAQSYVDEKIQTEDIQIKEQKPQTPEEKEQQQAEAEVKAETEPQPQTEAEHAKSDVEGYGIEVRAGVFGSQMNTKDKYSNANAQLVSQPSLTIDVDLHWRFNENYAAYLQAGFSYLMWGPPSQSSSLSNMDRSTYLFSGLIGGEWKPIENLAARLGGGMTQTAFFSGSASRYGLQTLAINTPIAHAGVYWYFGAAEATYFFPANTNNIEFKSGQGFAVGVDNSLFATDWTWRLMYEWRSQDSTFIETTDQRVVATVGYNWGAEK